MSNNYRKAQQARTYNPYGTGSTASQNHQELLEEFEKMLNGDSKDAYTPSIGDKVKYGSYDAEVKNVLTTPTVKGDVVIMFDNDNLIPRYMTVKRENLRLTKKNFNAKVKICTCGGESISVNHHYDWCDIHDKK